MSTRTSAPAPDYTVVRDGHIECYDVKTAPGNIPTVQSLADAVQTGTREAWGAQQSLDVKALHTSLAKVKSAMHSALCHGVRDELAAELQRRGFGGGI